MLRSITLVIVGLIVFAGGIWPNVARADSEPIKLVWKNASGLTSHVRLVKAFRCVKVKGKESFEISPRRTLSYTVYYDKDECDSDRLFHFYLKKDVSLGSKQLKADIYFKIGYDDEPSIEVSVAQHPKPGGVDRWFEAWCTDTNVYCLNTKVSPQERHQFTLETKRYFLNIGASLRYGR